ncbi:hypothetical protein V6N12_037296 [Hibiscus sabdariffa]|uniref:Uncharacterized protein n=1 Tax=Hibiscus sabdariffa TaxID=183260 RepID=A0ABR2C3I8_9ROSI
MYPQTQQIVFTSRTDDSTGLQCKACSSFSLLDQTQESGRGSVEPNGRIALARWARGLPGVGSTHQLSRVRFE